ncbi:hypothetical protein niasHT_023118 [Heterodera trifolii]|uniref:Uncharacterized protein n=1 Tax=Heterodera trifolii TaxID=157864 RepID=A0ABD2KF90_9BILA
MNKMLTKVWPKPATKALPTTVPLATKKAVCLAVLVVKIIMIIIIIIMALLVETVLVKGMNTMQLCTVPHLLASVLALLVVVAPAVVAVAVLVDTDNGNASAGAYNANDFRHNDNDGKNIVPNGIDYWNACVPACTPLSLKTCATTIVSSEDEQGEPVVCRCKWTACERCVPLVKDE